MSVHSFMPIDVSVSLLNYRHFIEECLMARGQHMNEIDQSQAVLVPTWF